MTDEVRWELKPVDAASFTGDARTVLLGGSSDGTSLKLFYVRFPPGARTNWHRHDGTQILLGMEGRCRVRLEGRPALELQPGDTVEIPPGVRHWHGAAPGGSGAHIAVNLANLATRWLEPVSDEEYAS